MIHIAHLDLIALLTYRVNIYMKKVSPNWETSTYLASFICNIVFVYDYLLVYFRKKKSNFLPFPNDIFGSTFILSSNKWIYAEEVFKNAGTI